MPYVMVTTASRATTCAGSKSAFKDHTTKEATIELTRGGSTTSLAQFAFSKDPAFQRAMAPTTICPPATAQAYATSPPPIQVTPSMGTRKLADTTSSIKQDRSRFAARRTEDPTMNAASPSPANAPGQITGSAAIHFVPYTTRERSGPSTP